MLKALDAEKQALAASAVKKAERISERWERLFPEYADELKSSALWGVMRAASSYQESGGETWERWLKMCVNGEAKNFLGQRYTKMRVLWPQEALEGVADDSETDSEPEYSEAIHNILGRLTKRQRELCELVYLKGMTPHAAGLVMGIRPNNACRLHQQAIERLRQSMAA